MIEVVAGFDEVVAGWAGKQLNATFVRPFAALGIVKDGQMAGAAIFNDYQGPNGNIELSYVGPGTVCRKVIGELARYAFITNKASRVTLKTKRTNPVCKLAPRLGFEFEAVLKRYYNTDKSGDAVVFVMTRPMAKRWLTGDRQ